MSFRRRATGRVRGPNSALTVFLHENGIDANLIRERHEQRMAELESQVASEDEAGSSRSETEIEIRQAASEKKRAARQRQSDSDEDEVVLTTRTRITRRNTRSKKVVDDEDDENDEDYIDEVADPSQPSARPIVTFCSVCQNRFSTRDPKVTVCSSCGGTGTITPRTRRNNTVVLTPDERRNQALARKKRKKVATALLDKQDWRTIPKLQDVCINLITRHIEDVEALGPWLGTGNLQKIGRILSRNRKLNSTTLRLFLFNDPASKSLEFWDCSQIDADALMLIPAYCPHIESLTLSMCGRLTNEVLLYFAEKLHNLRDIYLDGAFLITKGTWMDFFELMSRRPNSSEGDVENIEESGSFPGRLRSLSIQNTHRFDSECLAYLIEVTPGITHLSLNRLSGLDDSAAFMMIAELSNLTHLSITHPPQESADSVIDDEAVITILSTIGNQLQTLHLDGCWGLTDAVVQAIQQHCTSLTDLSLAGLDFLTSSAVANLFDHWIDINKPGLISLNLDRCLELGDDALNAIIRHSRATLVELNINSMRHLTADSLHLLCNLHLLTTLNVGFVRAVNDSLVKEISFACPSLKIIEVYGDHKVTANCQYPPGVKLIGRTSDMF